MVEGDAAIPGVSGPQRGVSPGWLPASAFIDEKILGDWRLKTLAKVRQIIHEADPAPSVLGDADGRSGEASSKPRFSASFQNGSRVAEEDDVGLGVMPKNGKLFAVARKTKLGNQLGLKIGYLIAIGTIERQKPDVVHAFIFGDQSERLTVRREMEGRIRWRIL